MRLKSIFLQSFRGFRDGTTFDIEDGINLLVGENGSGKSSVLNSVEWCLFGRDIEKGASGLYERKDWEVAHRVGDGAPTLVRLTFDNGEGDILVTRSREANAKRTEADRFQVELPDGQVLSERDAEDSLAENGFPSWSEWKCRYCQHQEAARDRLIDKDNRTASLAALLGLDEIMEVRKSLDGLKLTAAKTELKKIESGIADDLETLLDSTASLDEARTMLHDQGIVPESLTRKRAMKDANTLLANAVELKEKLELIAALPDSFADLDQALDWAGGWSDTVRSERGRLAQLDNLRTENAAISGVLAKIEPLVSNADEAEKTLRNSIDAEGDLEHRQQALNTAKAEFEKIDMMRKANDRLGALLQDVAGILENKPSDTCPVCESEVPGLSEKVGVRLQNMSSQIAVDLNQSLEAARTAEKKAQTSFDALNGLHEQVTKAQGKLEAEITNLSGLLPGHVKDDPIAAAKSQSEVLHEQIEKIEPLAGERDEALEDHAERTECLRAMSRYLKALERQNRRVDLRTLPAWGKFQQALTEMASLIIDCEAVAVLARELQKECSDKRQALVNERLSKYFAMITGEENAEAHGLRVTAKITPKKIDYNVVDAGGKPQVPILNQAALNAISMSMLFAQAAHVSDGGGPSILLLDDPEQSLDQKHVNGLAKAIEDAASRGAVLVGVPPGRLEKRIKEYASCAKRFIRVSERNSSMAVANEPQEHES